MALACVIPSIDGKDQGVASARRLLIAVVMAKSSTARYLGGVVEWLMAPVLKFEFNILDCFGQVWTALLHWPEFSAEQF